VARIKGVPAGHAAPSVKIAYWFTRRHFARLTGREPGRGIEPLQICAHVPRLLRAYGRFEQAVAKLHGLDRRADALAELMAATLIHCAFCVDLASQISRQRGLSDGELLALPAYRTSGLFSDVDKLVLDYAVAMTRTPVEVPDELFGRLKQHFDDAQLVQLTFLIALENLRARFNVALGIGAAGFSEGMVCARPVPAEEIA